MRPREISNALGSAAKLQALGVLRPGDSLVEYLAEAMMATMDGHSGRDCGASAWALATLGWAPSPSWLSAFALHLEAHAVCNMDAQALSNLLWALGRWNLSVPTGLMDAVQTALSPLMLQRCSPQALSNILWGFSKLSHKPGPVWMASYWEAVYKVAREGLAEGGKGCQILKKGNGI